MNTFKLLITEDSESDLDVCRSSIEKYNDKYNRTFELVECKSVDEAFQQLDHSFDGAIIDLKLADLGNEGNQVLKLIDDSNLRMPVAIVTGTPDAADTEFDYIGTYKKGEFDYDELLNSFWKIHDTGLARIMGGRGVIEGALNRIFKESLLPNRTLWENYGEQDPARTERGLLRHTMSHLLQLLNSQDDTIYPEEAYLFPPLSSELRSGSIVKNKETGDCFAIVNPACDLVVRPSGDFKTDHILIMGIEKDSPILDAEVGETKKTEKIEKQLKKVFSNNHTPYYHTLPKTAFFEGGMLNFRKINAIEKTCFNEEFDQPSVQISPEITKDILSRFSSYYARQGQPDIDHGLRIEQICKGKAEEQQAMSVKSS